MRKVIFLFTTIALAGCGAAVPGYSPDSPAKVPDALKPFNGGKMDPTGRYVVSTEERALTCGKLTGSMQVIMTRLKDSASRPRPSAATTTLQTLSTPLYGKGADLDVDDEIKQARGRLKAYNELLAEKKCKTLDISHA